MNTTKGAVILVSERVGGAKSQDVTQLNKVTLQVSKIKEGCFLSIKEALIAAEALTDTQVIIQIDKGIYKEKLEIRIDNLTLQGEDAEETIITYGDYALEILEDGEKRGTFRTATLFIDANDFTAKNITFENSAGPGKMVGQALALYVDGDRMTFENCRLLGGQDTLFTAPLPAKAFEKNGFKGPKELEPRIHGRHLYKKCFICGDVDFIFGGATAYFEECEIFSNNTNQEINGYVTAASTLEEEAGYVFNRCTFTSDCKPKSVYLGRPWRNHAKVAILNSDIGEHIKEEGWDDWGKTDARHTVCFAEFNNTGIGADTMKRPSWIKLLTEEEAVQYDKDKILGNWFS